MTLSWRFWEAPVERLRKVAGFTLLIAGLIGCLLPLVPGGPMVIAGVALLGADHPRIRPTIRRLEQWGDWCERKWRSLVKERKS